MRRLYLIIIYMCLTLVVGRVHAQYYSVNYDKQIVAAMAAAFGAGAMAESYYNELEKPLNFDPFGHARFAHLFVLYD